MYLLQHPHLLGALWKPLSLAFWLEHRQRLNARIGSAQRPRTPAGTLFCRLLKFVGQIGFAAMSAAVLLHAGNLRQNRHNDCAGRRQLRLEMCAYVCIRRQLVKEKATIEVRTLCVTPNCRSFFRRKNGLVARMGCSSSEMW